MEIIKSKGLIRHTDLSSEQFLKLLTEQPIIVYEDIQAAKIWCSYNNSEKTWEIKPKSPNSIAINMVDLAYQKYYKYVYAFLLSLPTEVTDLLRSGYQFAFEYFPDNQPANIEYDRMPKNGLILTCICKYGKYFSYDYNEIKTYADLFKVDTLPVLYKGKLNEKQLKAITFYLHTAPNDLDFLYNEISFTKFFYNLLCPNETASFLKHNEFNKNTEKIIIRFLNSDCELTLEILNSMYTKIIHKSESEFSDVYSVILFKFVEWLIVQDISDIETSGNTRDLLYINLISKLFNTWIAKYEKNIVDFKFTIPVFFNQDKFKINQDFIHNKTTLDYINKDAKLEYAFKILLSSFQKERKKPIGIINEQTLIHLNSLVRKIQIRIEELLNWNHKLSQFSYRQKNLSGFDNLKWEEDEKGYVYPNMTGALSAEPDQKKKGIKKIFK